MDDRAPPPIGEHRLLGDGRASALVRPGGEVDWWCAPDLDSPPLLWSLLDAAGAAARWRGTRYADAETRPAGPTTWTDLHAGAGRVRCWDGLLHQSGTAALIRLVRAVDGPVTVHHELSLGGFDRPWAAWSGRRGDLGDGTPVAVHGGHSASDGRRLVTSLDARPGCWTALVVTVGPADIEPDADALAARLAGLDGAQRRLLERARLPRRHRERARDALAVLRCCTYEPTGAVVASPTTSLPEAPGHDRQFDYRYAWLRDASLAASVAALLEQLEVAERHLDFVVHLARAAPELGPLATVRGDPVPTERPVAGVAGWAGSRPVRVGNAAAGQEQLDALGMVVEAVSVYLQQGGSLDEPLWRLVERIACRACDPPGPTHGIWELRRPQRLVSADIGRWLALDRAIWISRGWRPLARRGAWKRARRQARRRVLAALGPGGTLPQTYDERGRADASALLAPLFRLVDRRDDRAGAVVDATRAALGAGAHLYRYEPGGDDGFDGAEATFIPASLWAVSALAGVGRVGEARRLLDDLCGQLPRLLPEEFDAERREGRGNVPLVWSHMELARALYVLDAATVRHRFGIAGLTAWRAARFVGARIRRRRREAHGGREEERA